MERHPLPFFLVPLVSVCSPVLLHLTGRLFPGATLSSGFSLGGTDLCLRMEQRESHTALVPCSLPASFRWLLYLRLYCFKPKATGSYGCYSLAALPVLTGLPNPTPNSVNNLLYSTLSANPCVILFFPAWTMMDPASL